MKRSTLKLVLRGETLRVLDRMELTRVIGGGDTAVVDTGGAATGCPNVGTGAPAK